MYSINFTWNECLSINYNIIHLIQCSVNQTKNSNSGVILQLSQVAYWSRQKQDDKHFIGFLSTVVSERIQTQKVVNKFNCFFVFFLLIVLAILIIYNVQLANIQKKKKPNLALLFYWALPFPVPRHRTLSFRDLRIYIDMNNQTSLDDRSMSLDERYMYVHVILILFNLALLPFA